MLQGFFNSSSIKLRLYGSDDKLPILRRAKTCSGFVLSTNKRWGGLWVSFLCPVIFLNCVQTLLQWPFFKLSFIQLPQDLLLLGFPTQKQNPFREKSTCILLWILEYMSIVKIWSVSMLELFETTENRNHNSTKGQFNQTDYSFGISWLGSIDSNCFFP